MNKNDGGPAFAVAQEIDACGMPRTGVWCGMSLRDYFAAHAPPQPEWFWQIATLESSHDRFFSWRLYYADRMIAELTKEPQP